MPRLVRQFCVAPGAADAAAEPRSHPVAERLLKSPDHAANAGGEWTFVAAAGPVGQYRRRTTIVSHTADTADTGARVIDVIEVVEWRSVIPFFGWVFAPALRRAISRHPGGDNRPWWSPVSPLDEHAARLLGALMLLAGLVGYLGSLVTTTVTYAAREFGVSIDSANGARSQGGALALIRADILLTLPLVAMADRIGRRRVLLWCSVLGTALTAVCGLMPGIWSFAAMQVFARGFVTAAATLIAVVGVEEMPAGARGWVSSVLVACAAVGSALTLALNVAADSNVRAWRVAFFVPLIVLFAMPKVARIVPETTRFLARTSDQTQQTQKHAGHKARALDRRLARRLLLMLFGSFLLNLAANPATQFQSEFLRTQRFFSAPRVSLFVLATNAPGAFGVLVGGLLADKRSRRRIVGIGLIVHGATNMLLFSSRGASMWTWSILGALIGAAALPGWAIYGSELFPTAVRARVNGSLQVAGRAGGALGLWLIGRHAGGGNLGRALSIIAIGELLTAVLVLTRYPETAGRELEHLSDSAPAPG